MMTLALAASSGCGGGHSADLEVIRSVPPYVLTVDDLVARTQRAPRELLVETQGLRVTGTLSRLPSGCAPGVVTCPGPNGKFVFKSSDPGSSTSMFVLLGADPPLVEGEQYVLLGEVGLAEDVPSRWVLRALVLAKVAR